MIKLCIILYIGLILFIFIFKDLNTKNIFIEDEALNHNTVIERIVREHKSLGNNIVFFNLNNTARIKNTINHFNRNSIYYISSDEMSDYLKSRNMKYTFVVNDFYNISTNDIIKLKDKNNNKIIINNEKRSEIKIELDKSKINVIDGDSLLYNNISYRLLGFDAPEIKQEFGEISKNYLISLIENASKVYISVAEYDIYSRVLAHLFIEDTPLSYYMILSRMGIQTITKYGDNGFPIIAENILILARQQGNLPFLSPSSYRKRESENPKTKARYKPINLLSQKDISFIYDEYKKITNIRTNN